MRIFLRKNSQVFPFYFVFWPPFLCSFPISSNSRPTVNIGLLQSDPGLKRWDFPTFFPTKGSFSGRMLLPRALSDWKMAVKSSPLSNQNPIKEPNCWHSFTGAWHVPMKWLQSGFVQKPFQGEKLARKARNLPINEVYLSRTRPKVSVRKSRALPGGLFLSLFPATALF